MRESFRKSPFWLLNVKKNPFLRRHPSWPPPHPKKADFFFGRPKIEGPNRAYAQANGSENVRKAFLNHHLLTPKRRKQIWGVLGSARGDLVWFLGTVHKSKVPPFWGDFEPPPFEAQKSVYVPTFDHFWGVWDQFTKNPKI